MTLQASQEDVAAARFAPWLARFRRTGLGEAELELQRSDGAPDPLARMAASNGLKVATRGIFFEQSVLARELGLESTRGSDAELALHAYRRWGQEGIRRLRGIFDVFIWDGRRDVLLAFRDQLGVEPLFYARAGDELLFSASPTTLVEQPGVPREPNRAILVETLHWRFPVPEETCLEGVRRVLPGHVLAVTNGSATATRYWNPFDDLEEQGWVEADELDEFDALLERSVSQCLELGPSGIFLSGGFDSVSIAAVARDLAERRGLAHPLALSLAFPTPESSEKDVQVGVARALGLQQILLGIEESVEPAGLVRRALELNAEAPLPQTYLWSGAYEALACAGAEEGTRVIMTGGGGDEWLGVDLLLAADLIRARQFGDLHRLVRSKLSSFHTPPLSTVRMLLWTYGLRPIIRYHVRGLLADHAPNVLRALKRRAFARAELPWLAPDPRLRAEVTQRQEVTVERAGEQREFGGRFRFYGSEWTAGTLDHPLVSEDRERDHEAGRRAGVQILHPYWEPDLLSFLYRVPPELLLRGGLEKGLVRGAIARRFPNFGFERQKKVLSTDYHFSVIRRELPNALNGLGGCKALADLGIVDRQLVPTLIDEGLAGSNASQLQRVWQLLTLEAWARSVA